MKVSYISQPWNDAEPPVESGSIAIWIYQVTRRLKKSCNVNIYAKRARSKKKETYDDGIRYRYISTYFDHWFIRIGKILRYRVFRYFSNQSHTKHPYFSTWRYYFGYIIQVAWDLRRTKTDIVHIQNLSQFVPIIRALNPRIKIVLHMHCEWLTQLDRKMIASRLRKTDLIIGCGKYTMQKIRIRFPEFASRCYTVYNGVDVNHFSEKRRINFLERDSIANILFVGRISPEKGLHILLDAFQKITQHYPQVRLTIAGPQVSMPSDFVFKISDDSSISGLSFFSNKNYFAYLQSLIPEELKERVTFLGSIPHSHLTRHYRNADVYVQPSFWEAFPFPVIEAMASGVPVVATRAGGIAEAVVDGKTGLLVESGDTIALAGAILRLLQNRDRREEMGKAARKRALKLFAWERIAESLLYLYKNNL